MDKPPESELRCVLFVAFMGQEEYQELSSFLQALHPAPQTASKESRVFA